MPVFTPLFGTGFEMGAIPLRPGKIALFGYPGNSSIQTSGRTGSYCLGVDAHDSGVAFYHGAGRSDLSFSFWTKETNPENGAFLLVRVYLDDGNAITISRVGNAYNVSVNGTTLPGTVNINPSQWANFQIQISIGNAGYIKTKVDGNTDIDYSGDTQQGASSSINRITFECNRWSYWGIVLYDDITIGYGDWTGDIRYDVLLPNGDTATHGWRQSGHSFKSAPAAPTVGVSAGPGLTGDYRYKLTFTDTDGETMASVASALVQPANQVNSLSNIPIGPNGTTGRKLYRTAAGGSVYKLAATIANNVDTTYNDSLTDGSLGADEPTNVCWDKIDERGPNDADFMSSAVNGEQELSDFQNWDSTKKLPLFLVHWIRAVKGTADSQQIKFLQKTGSTLYTSTAHDLLTSTHYEFDLRTVDPAGATWDDSVIDTLQAGVEQVIP